MTVERWHELVAGAEGDDVTTGRLFSAAGLRTGRRFFALWFHGQLVVKLPPARSRPLLDAGSAEPFEPMPGREMHGWVVVHPGADWTALVAEARDFVAAAAA